MNGASDNDPRWRALIEGEFTCRDCGGTHQGMFDLAMPCPDIWQGDRTQRPNSDVAASPDHVLTEDFCILGGGHFYIRAVLPLPLIGMPGETFSYGVWSSLSPANFDLYRDGFDEDEPADPGPWFGWFSNRLKGYPDTLNLKCQVHPRAGGQRPWLELEPTDHPLAIEQREGITIARLMEIYALHGHDMRPGLPQ